MPLLEHISLDKGLTSLLVWHIAESEEWFRERLPQLQAVGHPKRRLQHLAGRYLLAQADPAFPYDDLRISAAGRPFVENGSRKFSISHSGEMATVIMSTKHEVGVDLEYITPRVLKAAPRFLGDVEKNGVRNVTGIMDFSNEALCGQKAMSICTLIWSAKEAAYKWLGIQGLDFAGDLEIEVIHPEKSGQIKARCRKDGDLSFRIGYQSLPNAWLTWVNEARHGLLSGM